MIKFLDCYDDEERYKPKAIEMKKFLAQSGQSMMYPLDYPFIEEHIDLHQDHILLDVGSGYGNISCILSKRCKKIFCVEVDGLVVDDGYEYQKNLGIDNIEYVIRDVEDMSCFGDNYFDRIISCSSIEHNPPEKSHKIMLEVARVLKLGGRCIITFSIGGEEYYKNSDIVDDIYIKDVPLKLVDPTPLKWEAGDSRFRTERDMATLALVYEK